MRTGNLFVLSGPSGAGKGTLIGLLLKRLEGVFLEIDVQGALQVRSKFPAAHLVFIAPPSMEELERRLRGRGTDSEESIRLRLANAEGEIRLKEEYDECFVNDDVDACLASLIAYVERFSEKKEEDRL